MPTLLAIDGGGTKTDLQLADAEGNLLASARCGSTSLTRRPVGAVEAELRSGIAAVTTAAGVSPADCTACCGGFAGAGATPNRERLRAILHAALPQAALLVVTDLEIAWQAATGGEDGILVIGGTGSAALGRRGWRSAYSFEEQQAAIPSGTEARAGGLGPGIDDVGSADWILRQAHEAKLIRDSDAGAEGMRRLLDDPRAEGILQQAGAGLAELAMRVAADMRWDDPTIAVAGGVFEHSELVRQSFAGVVAQHLPAARVLPPGPRPVEGAMQLALHCHGKFMCDV